MKKIQKKISNQLFILRLISKASKWRIFLTITFSILDSILSFLLFVLLVRYILNSFSYHISIKEVLCNTCILLITKAVLSTLKHFYETCYVPNSDLRVKAYIRETIFAKAKSVDISCFENPEFYDNYVKALDEADNRAFEILDQISSIIGSGVYIILAGVVLFSISKIVLAFLLIPVIVGSIVGRLSNNLNFELFNRTMPFIRKKEYVNRTFFLKDYAHEIRITNIAVLLIDKYVVAVKELISLTKRYGFKLSMLQYIFFLSNEVIGDLFVLIYASYATVVTKTIALGDFFVIIDSLGDIAWALKEVVDIANDLHNNSLYIENLRSFLEYECIIEKDNIAALKISSEPERIKFEHVYFSYDGQSNYALEDLCLDIEPGSKVAIVGENGAGKTTLIKLLLRFYDPQQGSIYLGENNIKNYDVREYRRLFCALFQDFNLFSLSLAENIALGEVTTENKAIVEAAFYSAGGASIIGKLSNGLDTTITREFDSNGVELSGGEKQKVAIARIFASNSKIAILDEPSSALDPIAEKEMYEVLLNGCSNRTVFFISHRLSSALLADKILYMEKGRVVETGTHRQLLNRNGAYARLFRKQAFNYNCEEEGVD